MQQVTTALEVKALDQRAISFERLGTHTGRSEYQVGAIYHGQKLL